MTQVELGQLLGMSQTAISLYESGDRKPDVETAKNIAKVLHTTLDSIFALNISKRNVTFQNERIKP